MTAALAFNQSTGEYEVEKAKEQVLVFPAHLIEDFKSWSTTGTITHPMSVSLMLKRTVYGDDVHYMDREKAEIDPSFKQLIPYTVFKRGEEVFCYQRTKKGGESRLYDKWSLGVGGHINPHDGEATNGAEAYWNGFRRELQEEVSFVNQASKNTDCPIVAVIYDDSNEVGKVHFGLVHLFIVPAGTELHSSDPALAKGQWIDIAALDKDKFENWSQLVIQHAL